MGLFCTISGTVVWTRDKISSQKIMFEYILFTIYRLIFISITISSSCGHGT